MSADKRGMAPLLDCPAMYRREAGYPFGESVPKTVRLLRTIAAGRAQGLILMLRGKQHPVAAVGTILPAWTNSFGAVSVVFPDGERLFVRPYDFEVVEWHEKRERM